MSANCRKGEGGLARRAARFQDAPCSAPPCTAYHVARFPGAVAPSRHPFNSSRPRSTVAARSSTPGPGTYHPDARRTTQTQFEHSFGGRKVLRPVVETRCLLGRKAKCAQCGCEPTGDYWEHRGGTALCRPCMAGKQAAASDRREALALSQYKKVRSCWMVHRHEGTVAAIVLMDPRSLRRLQEKEAYFQQYFA
ncbi:uncharacterized protein LOC134532781 [Bacillus rossius redtenbacheri]|uniref:uncharacterized protein LOC134532781 n=1 Tax=Bacillus rossius redtenbacheri TaxID=93214 RepID=UPI002FDE1543